LRGLILAMGRLEADCHDKDKAQALRGDDSFEAALDKGTSILEKYLTVRDRAYGGRMGSIGWPPNYNPEHLLLSVEAPSANRRVMVTRHRNPASVDANARDQYERCYVLVRKNGQWRVDSLKERYFGEDRWKTAIL